VIFALTVLPVAATPAFSPDALMLRNAEPAGADVTRTLIAYVSEVAAALGKVRVIGVMFSTPTCAVGIVPTVTAVGAAALADTEESIPKPKAATATSAMRLKVVFVDICFLSISRTEEFPQFGLNQISLVLFDESHVLIHQIPHRVSGRGEETYLFVCHLHCLR